MLRGFIFLIAVIFMLPGTGFSQRPVNDDLSAAIVLAGSSGQVSGSNSGATLEAEEPVHIDGSPNTMTNTIWYKWTAPSNGPVIIDTEGVSFWHGVLVYTVTNFALTKVCPESGVWPDDEAGFKAQAGQQYWIAVGGYYGSAGPISLEWKQYPAVVNDYFTNATELSGISGHVFAANVFCSREELEPVHAGVDPYFYGNRASVWWTWTAPSNGLVFFNADVSEFDAAVAVYAGSAMAELTEVVSAEDSVSFQAQQGTTYRIAVEGSEWEWGGVELKWSMPSPGSGKADLANFFLEGDPSRLQSADTNFRSAVDENSQDYQAKIYASLTRIGNLINDSELKSLMTRFGFNYLDSGTNGWEFSGSFTPAGPLPSNQEVDKIWSRCQPSLDEALALLDSIPSNWTGTAEISWDCFPVDETVYVDYPDVLAAKAMLKAARSFLNTIRAYDMTIDYQKLDWPLTAPVKAITVDGNSNDWATVPVQLYGEEGSVLNAAKVCRNGNKIYVLIDRNPDSLAGSMESNECFYGGVMLRMDDGSKDELQFQGYLSAYGTGISFKAGTMDSWTNGVVMSAGNFIELSCEVPENLGTVMDAGYLTSVGYGSPEWWYWWSPPYMIDRSDWWDFYCDEEMTFLANHPANLLLAMAPDALKSVRNSAALIEAKSNLFDAVVLGQMAGGLIKNRSDAMLHFFEYDPADAIAYDDVMALMADIKTSLSQPVLFTSNDGTSDVTVHLGAFYASPYVTRSMLPAYAPAALLRNPISGSFPDPTFGGILSDMTQGSLAAGLAGYPLNVPAPFSVVASQSTSSSKIEISWLPVEGADWYEVWRSASSDFSGAVKVKTVDVCGYADSNLEPGSTYYYKVRGGNDYQTGAFSTSPIVGITRARLAMPWLNLLLE